MTARQARSKRAPRSLPDFFVYTISVVLNCLVALEVFLYQCDQLSRVVAQMHPFL